MANCINPNTKEFKALAKQSNINPIVLAAKISLWQETNGLEKYPTKEDLNIVPQITSKDKIIFGHPGIGKTYLKESGRTDVIDFDSDYKVKINQKFNLPEGFKARNDFQRDNKEIYQKEIRNLWKEAKQEAKKTGKQLFASDMLLLREFEKDFDKVVTMSKETFINRAKQRNDYTPGLEGTEGWKNNLDTTISKVPSSKLIITDKYLSELLPKQKTEGNKTQALLSFLESYGFDVQESEELLINLASKRIDLNTADISQVAKAISSPLAEMLSYSDTFYEIEKAVVDTQRFKDLYSDLLDEFTDSTKRNLKRLATKQIFKELLEKGFTEELAADLNIDKTLWDKLVDFVATVINKLKGADWDVIDRNISKVVEKTFKGEDYIRLTKKEGYKQVDFQQAFDENSIAKDIMTKIGTNPNIVLTGSIAYATQGTVYRKIETVVHDLDFVNNGLSTEEVESLVKDNYPDSIKAYSFFDKYQVDTYLIPPKGYEISNIQRRETGKITSYEIINKQGETVGTYKLKYDVSSTGKTINEVEAKSGIEAMLVDFFSQDTLDRGTVSQDFNGSDGKTHKVQLSKFEAPFEAKLTYSRFKDIWDYNRFIPNKPQEETVSFLPEGVKIGPVSANKVSSLVEKRMPVSGVGTTLSKEKAIALVRYNKKQTDHKIQYDAVKLNENTGEYTYKWKITAGAVTGFKKLQQEVANRNAEASYRNRSIAPVSDSIEDSTYQGDIFNSLDDLDQAKKEGDQFILFNPTTTVATNYNSVIDFKKVVLKQIDKRLRDAQQKSKTDKSSNLKQEIRELTTLRQKVIKDINGLINDPDIFERTMAIFNQDIAFMKSLIATKTLENLHLAETYIDYFRSISNYSGTNISNTFIVDTSDPNLIDPDIRKVLDKLTIEMQNAEGDIVQAKKDYLLEIIDDSDVLKTMFGNDSEEIRDIILAIDKDTKEQTQKDLDKFSKYLLSADTSMGTKDLLGQLIVNVLKEKKATTKVEANQFIQAISNIEDKVKEELSKLGFGITYFSKLPLLGKHISEVSYDLFYQKTAKGNRTGRLVGKFAHKWFQDVFRFMRKSTKELDTAIANGDGGKINQILIEKYNWLNEKAEFVQLQKLPEVINNPAFSMFSQYFNQAEAAVYSTKLKDRIGEHEYKKLVQQQVTFLEQYVYNLTEDLNELMQDHGVSSPAQLPMDVIHSYNISAKRKNPFEFIASNAAGQQGRVDYIINQTGNQYQSFINYNTYIPKEEIKTFNVFTNSSQTTDSGYYDPNFSTVENNPTLLEFWETISEATEWMNNNLNDASTPLSHNSILRMEKSILDVLLSKNTGVLNKAIFLKKSTASFLKGLFTKPIRNISEGEKVALRNVQTLEGPVNQRFNTILMALSNASGTKITSTTVLDLNTLNPATYDILNKVTENSMAAIAMADGDKFNVNTLREFLTNQVMEEQTFNLPVMLRAYLDATGTYKAQKEALPKINILKDLYDDIKAETPQQNKIVSKVQSVVAKYTGKRRSSDLTDKRVNAEQRMNHWIDKAVKNEGENDMSDLQYYWAKLGKTYTPDEKLFLKESKDYLNLLKQNLVTAEDAINNFNPTATTPNSKSLTELEEERDAIVNEIDHVEHIVENTGHYYALSAAYDTIASRLTIFKGLAWGVKAQVMNRVQGIHSALIHDTGRYWTQGNIYSAMAFVNRKGTRRLPGMHTYRQEVRKAKLLIEMLGVLQDATNELDRAKNNSGLRGYTKKLNPFYLTEYVEWHNQTPMILAMLKDHEIESPTLKDENGNPVKVPIFNAEKKVIKLQGGGTYTLDYGFPAYNVENGKLVLKADFNSQENADTWMNFSTKKGKDIYSHIDTSLAQINGDYRGDAAIYAKKGAFGRSMLTFKSWVAMNYYVRFAKNTTNLNLGIKDFDGAYTGALKGGKSSVVGGVGVGAIAGAGAVLTGGGLVLGGLVALGAIGYGAWKANQQRKATGEEVKAMLQLAAGGKALLKKGIGVPVNLVTGRDLIKAHTFNELDLTPEEKQNLHMIINEVANIAIGMLIFVMYKSFFGDDEEDEPKTIIDPATGATILNPLYGKEKKTSMETGMNNLLENQLTEFIQSSAQYVNPMTSWDLFTSPASVEGWFKTATDLGDAIYKSYVVGSKLSSGPNEGKNRIGVAAVKGILPGIVGEYVLHEEKEEDIPYSFGFGNAMRTEWQKNDWFDAMYISDYKEDRSEIEEKRKEYKEERIEYWKKEKEALLEQYKDDPMRLDIINKRIARLAGKETQAALPYPNRALYDESQTKINP